MRIQLKGELGAELRALDLKPGDIIEGAEPSSCFEDTTAMAFKYFRFGVSHLCVVARANYDIVDEPIGNVISHNTFNGVVWDGQAIEAINNTAKALLNITELFKSQNIQIDSLLKISDQANPLEGGDA